MTRLLSLPESQWFERKSGAIRPQDLAIPMVAMANSEGGVIVAGLHAGEVVGVDARADNALRQAAIDFTAPPVRVRVTALDASDGRVLVFRVSPGELVHETHKGECYLRVGDESRRLSFVQRQELEWDRGSASFEGTAVPGARVDDLAGSVLQDFQARLGSSSADLALGARDLLTRDGGVTVAGYLLLSERPQVTYPNAHVRVLKYGSVDRGVGRSLALEEGGDVRCEGPIVQQIDEAARAIDRLLPRRQALTDSGRFEATPVIPRDAWLEGLVNAVVHRSYSMSGDHVRVEIFPNRIEITSPGRFPGIADPTRAKVISRNARNPRIARVCADLGVTRELGEGIRRIYAEMRRVGLSEPMYVQSSEAVRLTLLAAHAVSDDVAERLGGTAIRILDAMRLAQRPLGTGQIVDLVGLARPTVIRHLGRLRAAGLVVWEGSQARDPRATWRVV
ncbi:ATP-binding protein [Actinomyces faecalis]|uniref:ATP-binding protein n=1 Tax=Actinomyces faecalis TaxID=2722820 RepID=UPI003CC83431